MNSLKTLLTTKHPHKYNSITTAGEEAGLTIEPTATIDGVNIQWVATNLEGFEFSMVSLPEANKFFRYEVALSIYGRFFYTSLARFKTLKGALEHISLFDDDDFLNLTFSELKEKDERLEFHKEVFESYENEIKMLKLQVKCNERSIEDMSKRNSFQSKKIQILTDLTDTYQQAVDVANNIIDELT